MQTDNNIKNKEFVMIFKKYYHANKLWYIRKIM